MSAATFLSETAPTAPIGLDTVRVSGGIGIRCDMRLGKSCIVDISERDGYKVRVPRRSVPPEAVLINTGGGIASGDDILQSVEVSEGASLTVTTQASERIYRSLNEAVTHVDVDLKLAPDAALNWLPQDTILFDGSRLQRRIRADVTGSSRLLLAETVVFGRAAMGETLHAGMFRDQWRIMRDGKLAFAENILLRDDTFDVLSAPAVTGGAQAVLTLIYVARDAEDRLAAVRKAVQNAGFECGASAWNGLLTVRALSPGTEPVRNLMKHLMPLFGNGDLPRVWWT